MASILIVEDSATQAAQLQFILKAHAFDVELARDGETALERLRADRFDLVLSDIIMPGISGYELCATIKSEFRDRNMPVILLTSLTEPSDILEGLVSGADNFVTKPFDEAYLLSRIRHVLENRRSSDGRRVDLGVEIQFMGKRLTINSDRQQVLDVLISALEEVHRTKQREYELKLVEERQRLEADILRQREELARKDWEELRAIVEKIPTAVALVFGDGEFHFANDSFLRVSGSLPCATVSEWLAGITEGASRRELERHLRNALLQAGHVERFELGLKLQNDRRLDWVMHLQRLRTDIAGRPTVLVAAVDVTDQKELIWQLSNARSQMEDFLAAAAHDLKAPLITIGHNISFARMGLGPDIPADAAKCLDRVQAAARDMLTLLGQVSDVSTAGRDTEPKQLHPATELINSALRQLDGLLSERGAIVHVAENLPQVRCQGTKLVQVFTNLISNAIKYTPPNTNPSIEIGCLDQADSVHQFYVRDHGVGIPAEHCGEIFELFRRLSADPRVEGQGVGLTIVKRIVELHGGRVWVDSTPGNGSTFYFTLPRSAEQRSSAVRAPHHVPVPSMAPPELPDHAPCTASNTA